LDVRKEDLGAFSAVETESSFVIEADPGVKNVFLLFKADCILSIKGTSAFSYGFALRDAVKKVFLVDYDF